MLRSAVINPTGREERPVSVEQMIAAMDQAGIAKSALVQASTCYGHDNSYIADAVAAHPNRFTGVFSVDVLAPDAPEKIRYWVGRKLTGMRLFTAGSTMPNQADWVDDPRSFPAWECAGELGIPVCMQMTVKAIPQLIRMLERFPKVPVILDHLAKPTLSDGPPYTGATDVFRLADYKNLYLKLTPRTVAEAQKREGHSRDLLPAARVEIRSFADRLGIELSGIGRNAPGTAEGFPGGFVRAVRRGSRLDLRQDGAGSLSRAGREVEGNRCPKHGHHGDSPDFVGCVPEHRRPEKQGELRSPLVNFAFADVKIANKAFKALVREQKFDLGELAIVTFLQAKAYGKPYVLMPAVVVARGQHHTIFYNPERGHLNPGDLNGRKVGVRAYTQTTGAWVRGFLQEDYGVDFRRVQWITFEDPHVAEYTDPPWVQRAPEGKQLLQMLLDGEIDAAIFGSENPEGTPLKPLIPDAAEVAARWAEKHGGVPINHMMVIKESITRSPPGRCPRGLPYAQGERGCRSLEKSGRAAIRRRGGTQVARNDHSIFRMPGFDPAPLLG